MITGTEADRSHGEMARAWMFCACWRSTPQLIGGRAQPQPEEGQRGLADDHGGNGQGGGRDDVGQKGRHDMAQDDARAGCSRESSAAITKSSSRRERKRPRTTRASSVQPMSEMIKVMAK